MYLLPKYQFCPQSSLWREHQASFVLQFGWCNGVFLKCSVTDNYGSMKWAQFKDPHGYMYLAGAVVACWFITQGVGDSNTPFCKNIFYRFCRFFRINLRKTQMCLRKCAMLRESSDSISGIVLLKCIQHLFKPSTEGYHLCGIVLSVSHFLSFSYQLQSPRRWQQQF